jgi:hypothetical protein
MKLETLASKPQLMKITIDDKNLVEKYGDAIEFHIYDRQDMDTFMKLASVEGTNQFSEISKVVQTLVLDAKGNPVLADGNTLPLDIMIKVVEAVIERLGNSMTQTSVK